MSPVTPLKHGWPRILLQGLMALLVLALGLLAFMIASGLFPEDSKPVELETPVLSVRTHAVRTEDRRMTIRSRGIVRPRVTSQLTSRVSGEILEVSPHLRPGAFFKKGQLLLRIDDTDYKAALEARRAEQAQAELALAIEENEADIAAREWSKLEMKREPDPLVLRVPQLAEARARLAAAKAAVERARLDLERTEVLAPYDGQVTERMVDLGRYLTIGTPMARIQGIEAAEVRLSLLDSELAFLDLPDDLVSTGGLFEGPRVWLESELFGEARIWTGRLVRLEGEIDARTQMIHVVARVEDPHNLVRKPGRVSLPVGLYVRARIEGSRIPGLLAIPRRAMQREGIVYVLSRPKDAKQRTGIEPDLATGASAKSSDLQGHAAKLGGNTTGGDGAGEDRNEKPVDKKPVEHQWVLSARRIRVLRQEGGQLYIAEGLEAGDRLCLTRIESFVEGMPVRPIDLDPETAPSNGPSSGDRPANGKPASGEAPGR